MKTVQKLIVIIALIAVIFGATGHALAAPGFSGTYQTATKSGTLSFTAQRCGSPYNSCMGYWTVDGVRYPGYFIQLRDGTNRISFNWFYDRNYTKAAGAVLATYDAASATYSGPITFYDRTSAVTDTGTALLK